MYEGLKRLYTGDFNSMNQEWQPDGSVIITLKEDKEGQSYCFRVKDLYGEREEVLEHKVIEVKQPKHIEARMKEARNEESSS